MKKKYQVKIVPFILLCTILAACTPGQVFEPTITSISTKTSTPTATFTPTSTTTQTPSLTPTNTVTATATRMNTPTPACLAINGTWKSNETTYPWGPILTFTVQNCAIAAWEIWTVPIPRELMNWSGNSIAISQNQFSHGEDTGMGIFTLRGVFDSPTSSHGTLFFPKGFSIFGAVLTTDISIPWTASP